MLVRASYRLQDMVLEVSLRDGPPDRSREDSFFRIQGLITSRFRVGNASSGVEYAKEVLDALPATVELFYEVAGQLCRQYAQW